MDEKPELIRRNYEFNVRAENDDQQGAIITGRPIVYNSLTDLGYFNEIHQVFVDNLRKKYHNVDMHYLSMGMTNDFETAIACGANMVRIGTAIFGARPYQIVSP
mgnify:CR=1 FL=1